MKKLPKILAAAGVVIALGGYGVADALDVVPGVLTMTPPPPTPAAPPSARGLEITPPAFPAAPAQKPPNVDKLRQAVHDFAGDKRLGSAQASAWIGTLDGRELAAYQGDLALPSASSVKLVTALAALETLGSQTRLETSVFWEPATQKLYLVPGGDVLLGREAGDPAAIVGHAGVKDLVDQTVKHLVKPGEKPSQVKVVLDSTLFGEDLNPAWDTDARLYVAPIQGLAFTGGLNPPNFDTYDPDPALSVANTYAAGLQAAGLAAQVERGGLPKGAKSQLVARVSSATIAEVVRHMLKVSDNTVADTLGRLVALRTGAPATFAGSAGAVKAAAAGLGVNMNGVNMAGCSGLSEQTQLPARALASAAALSLNSGYPQLATAMANVPVAGVDGTLWAYFRGTPLAGVLRAKTGSLATTTSLTGVLEREGTPLVFSVIISGWGANPAGSPLDLRNDLVTAWSGHPVKWVHEAKTQ